MSDDIRIDARDYVDPRTTLGHRMWCRYQEAFRPLAELAANRHVMTLVEFRALCRDRRIVKHLAYQGERLVGFGALTNDLDAVPLISPAYYRARWPEPFEQARIWYVVFICTDHTAQAYSHLLDSMSSPAREFGGVVGMDFCTHNARSLRLPRVSTLILHRLGAPPRAAHVDSQEFHVFEFDPQEGTP